jgi:hypothetical protein
MFTDHAHDLAEALLGQSERSQKAAFTGILSKPFDVDVFVDVVAAAAAATTRDKPGMSDALLEGSVAPLNPTGAIGRPWWALWRA